MAQPVVGLQDAAQLAVPGHVEACVGGEHDQPGAAVSPADPALSDTDKRRNSQTSHERYKSIKVDLEYVWAEMFSVPVR